MLTQEYLLVLRVRQPNLNTFSNHGKILFAHILALTERKETTNTVGEGEGWDGVNALPHSDPYLTVLLCSSKHCSSGVMCFNLMILLDPESQRISQNCILKFSLYVDEEIIIIWKDHWGDLTQ